jgi:hypothetical protein
MNTIKMNTLALLVPALLGMAAIGTAADKSASQTLTLSPLASGDSGANTLDSDIASIALPSINTRKERVTYSRPLAEDANIQAPAKAYTKESRSFKMEVSGDALRKGVSIPTSSSSPVIRLVPQAKADAVRTEQLRIEMDGRWQTGKEAFKTVADKNALRAAGFEATGDTLAMQLKPSALPGPVKLKVDGLKSGKGKYSVLVFEPNSDKVLKLRASNTRLLRGETLNMEVDLLSAGKTLTLDQAEGFVVGPDGKALKSAALTLKDGVASASIDTQSLSSSAPGLWEFHVNTRQGEGEEQVLRSAKVAFALAPKTARLLGTVSYDLPATDADALTLGFDVEAGIAGRYEISAVIYGQDGNSTRAGVFASTAQWLDGAGTITLVVPVDHLAEAGISAPYEVRHLRLKDQTRMADLRSQNKSLVINEAP